MFSITAQRLKFLREQKKLSKTEISKLLGISRTAYINYENGKNKPSRKIKELCALYNVSADYILGTDIQNNNSSNSQEATNENKEAILEPTSLNCTISTLQQMFRSEISEDEEKIVFFYRGLSAEEQQDMQYYCQLSEAARRRVNRTIKGEYEDMVKEQKSAQDSG